MSYKQQHLLYFSYRFHTFTEETIGAYVEYVFLICPTSHFYRADLGIKWEVGNVNWTPCFQNLSHHPCYCSIVPYYDTIGRLIQITIRIIALNPLRKTYIHTYIMAGHSISKTPVY